ncbi:MAG: HEAT repeat domain-containing protein [Terriglobia bacterium]
MHLGFLIAGILVPVFPPIAAAQVSYVARFEQEKTSYLQGEPVFCKFTIRNTGAEPFAFSYRTPSRAPNSELEGEPHFSVRDLKGRPLSDPAPKPCGGAKGTTVYGSVSLPPGQTHTERWLLNQWARFSKPGSFRVRARRRLPLLGFNPAQQDFSGTPVAFALAVNEFTFEISPSTPEELQKAFEPYVTALEKPARPEAAEALLVLSTLPQPFVSEKLATIGRAPAGERGLDRQQALQGLARLGTPEAWAVILDIARGSDGAALEAAGKTEDDSLRAYAVLLLGEKDDAKFVPPLLEMLRGTSDSLRGEVLRTLGLFNDTRANQALFDALRSPSVSDRVNAILGLRNLGTREVVPALIATLSDPEGQVRRVGHFALLGLTRQMIYLSPKATAAESRRAADEWHAWWRDHGASFTPTPQAPCRDW